MRFQSTVVLRGIVAILMAFTLIGLIGAPASAQTVTSEQHSEQSTSVSSESHSSSQTETTVNGQTTIISSESHVTSQSGTGDQTGEVSIVSISVGDEAGTQAEDGLRTSQAVTTSDVPSVAELDIPTANELVADIVDLLKEILLDF